MPDRTLPFLQAREHLQIDRLTIKIYNSSIELTKAAAWLAQDYLQSLLNRQETVRVILATGNSQLQFLDSLINDFSLDWSRVIFYHLDEYLGLSAKHSGSFRYYLNQKVVSSLNKCQFHFIEGDAVEPLQECDRYTKLLQQQPIDLCLLGIGDNGHLAFNEPSLADFTDSHWVKLVQLETKTRQQQVNGGYFPSLDAVPQYAYTLTIPAICAAKKIFCLAPGKHKAKVVKRTLKGDIAPNFPATILRTLPQATLFCEDYRRFAP